MKMYFNIFKSRLDTRLLALKRRREYVETYGTDELKFLSSEDSDLTEVDHKGFPTDLFVSTKNISGYVRRGEILRGYKSSYGRPSHCKKNSFMLSTLSWLGGSETRSIGQVSNWVRYGGGRADSLRYLSKYNKLKTNAKSINLKYSTTKYASMLGLSRGELTPRSIDEVQISQSVNAQANPGPSFTTVGSAHKYESYDLAFSCAREFISSLDKGDAPADPLFSISGRAKLLTREKLNAKLTNSEPVGRAVWMADQHEAHLCGVFSGPLNRFFKRTQKIIKLGYNKFSADSERMCGEFSKYDTFINLDFSKLDSSLQGRLIHEAFNIIRFAFDIGRCEPWVSKLLSRIENWFRNTTVVLPSGELIVKPGGTPSGSDFVSIINSLCVSIAIIDGMRKAYSGEVHSSYGLAVYGDNTLIGINTRSRNPDIRVRRGKSVFNSLSSYLGEQFGLTINPDETRVVPFFFVKMATPKIYGNLEIADMSSDVVIAQRAELEERLGRKLKFREKLRYIYDEPSDGYKGDTHRWTYVYSGSASFLSYYWKEDFSMIRPQMEVLIRLVHPEKAPVTIQEHRERLISALIENQNNKHCVNRIMHYYYDSIKMEEVGIVTRQDADRDLMYIRLNGYPIPEDRTKLPYEIKDIGCRAWYRRQRKIVHLEEHPAMSDFFLKWDDLMRGARRAVRNLSSELWFFVKSSRAQAALSRGLGCRVYSPHFSGLGEVKKRLRFLGHLYSRPDFINAVSSAVLNLDPDGLKQAVENIVQGNLVQPFHQLEAGVCIALR